MTLHLGCRWSCTHDVNIALSHQTVGFECSRILIILKPRLRLDWGYIGGLKIWCDTPTPQDNLMNIIVWNQPKIAIFFNGQDSQSYHSLMQPRFKGGWLPSIFNQQCCWISGHMLTKHLHSTLEWWLSGVAESKSAAKKWLESFCKYGLFWGMTSAVTSSKSLRTTRINTDKCIEVDKDKQWRFCFSVVLCSKSAFLPNCSVQYLLHRKEIAAINPLN